MNHQLEALEYHQCFQHESEQVDMTTTLSINTLCNYYYYSYFIQHLKDAQFFTSVQCNGDKRRSDLSTVEVLDDGEMEMLLPLPLALHGVIKKLTQGSLGPFQQLVVQQKCV